MMSIEKNIEAVRELIGALAYDRKINAIKALRTLTGLGLKEARDEVERFFRVLQGQLAQGRQYSYHISHKDAIVQDYRAHDQRRYLFVPIRSATLTDQFVPDTYDNAQRIAMEKAKPDEPYTVVRVMGKAMASRATWHPTDTSDERPF